MADTVLSTLNVRLAYLLGDPNTPEGTEVAAYGANGEGDGITYSAKDRDIFLTIGLRALISLLSGASLKALGLNFSYILKIKVDDKDFQLPDDCARVVGVQWYGKKVLHFPMDDGRRSHILWQNTPKYYIDFDNNKPTLKIELPASTTRIDDCYCWYLKKIPDLHSDPVEFTEDILLNEYYQDKVLRLAEIQGRRFHQEIHTHLKQDLIEDIKMEK